MLPWNISHDHSSPGVDNSGGRDPVRRRPVPSTGDVGSQRLCVTRCMVWKRVPELWVSARNGLAEGLYLITYLPVWCQGFGSISVLSGSSRGPFTRGAHCLFVCCFFHWATCCCLWSTAPRGQRRRRGEGNRRGMNVSFHLRPPFPTPIHPSDPKIPRTPQPDSLTRAKGNKDVHSCGRRPSPETRCRLSDMMPSGSDRILARQCSRRPPLAHIGLTCNQ